MDVELALKINRLVHNECKDVPHDIGLRITELVNKHQDQLRLNVVMQEFNSLIVRLVELLSVKYPNRKINNEFVENLKTVWKGNELGLKANIEALEKELNFV